MVLILHRMQSSDIISLILENFYLKSSSCFLVVFDENGHYCCRNAVPPHNEASQQTISRWIKQVLNKAGLDLTIFTPHSTRSASTTKAKAANIPLSTILKTAGWSRESTFAKYYNKQISDEEVFADAIRHQSQ